MRVIVMIEKKWMTSCILAYWVKSARGILHGRNAKSSYLCNIVGDVAKMIAAYAYGDEPVVPDIAAHNLIYFTKIKMTVDTYQIKLYHWCHHEIRRYVEYKYGYFMTSSSDGDDAGMLGDTVVSMFDMIELITTGVSSGVFDSMHFIMHGCKASSAYYNPESEDGVRTACEMQRIRAQFLAAPPVKLQTSSAPRM